MNVKELSTAELDRVIGAGIVGDASAALVALSHAVVDGVSAGIGALAKAGPGGFGLGPLPSGPQSGVAPKSTWL